MVVVDLAVQQLAGIQRIHARLQLFSRAETDHAMLRNDDLMFWLVGISALFGLGHLDDEGAEASKGHFFSVRQLFDDHIDELIDDVGSDGLIDAAFCTYSGNQVFLCDSGHASVINSSGRPCNVEPTFFRIFAYPSELK